MAPRLNADEIKLRGLLLANNKELLDLHRTLVRGGLITEEEFWETRKVRIDRLQSLYVKPLLENQEILGRQRKPMSSAFSSSIASVKATGDYEGEQKIILTPETITLILAQSSGLQRAHQENVPHRVSPCHMIRV